MGLYWLFGFIGFTIRALIVRLFAGSFRVRCFSLRFE